MDEFRELSAGKTLYNGKYIIERTLGMGGFGITYYAIHATLHKYYAIKEFFINGYCVRNTQSSEVHLQGMTTETYINYKQNFKKEAQTLAELDHPYIVKIVDVFEENNTSYIVMPFIKGVTLQQLVNKYEKLEYETAVNYIAQIAEAIEYIHGHYILHRDISPDNVIITPENKIALIDFGSAREFVHDKTQRHTTIVKKGYAPLEQYAAISRKGAYSDIYALGAVFYFTLTGRKPMDATERTLENMFEPIFLVPSIPEDANRTIMKAMSLKPENRHQNIKEFMDDLLGKKAKRNILKNKVFILLGGALAALLTVIVIWFISSNKPESNVVPPPGPDPDGIIDTIPPPPPPPTMEEIIKETLNKANKAFNLAQYEIAFDLYQELQTLKPDDDTGYKNFMLIAKEIIPLVGYSEDVEYFLLYAQKLKKTEEVNELLLKCK